MRQGSEGPGDLAEDSPGKWELEVRTSARDEEHHKRTTLPLDRDKGQGRQEQEGQQQVMIQERLEVISGQNKAVTGNCPAVTSGHTD